MRPSVPTSPLQTVARWALGLVLAFTGTAHLTFSRDSFLAQVPSWVPLDPDFIVLASGLVELALAAALLSMASRKTIVGWVVAAFFVAIFPGNIAQYTEKVNSFGLDTDTARLTRLLFQPLLVAWALWSTGAWTALRGSNDASGPGLHDGRAERLD
ncbi:MAG: putative membrane protein [Glaciecola sp.]|jgi:uncharacterized membrane protein